MALTLEEKRRAQRRKKKRKNRRPTYAEGNILALSFDYLHATQNFTDGRREKKKKKERAEIKLPPKEAAERPSAARGKRVTKRTRKGEKGEKKGEEASLFPAHHKKKRIFRVPLHPCRKRTKNQRDESEEK